jgi:hypothetical protein
MSTETDKKEARSYRAWQLTVLPVLAVCTLGLLASMYGCATAVLEEWPMDADPLANAVAEVEALVQPAREVGPDLPTVQVPQVVWEGLVADLPAESDTEGQICTPTVCERPHSDEAPAAPVATPSSSDKVSIILILAGLVLVPFLLFKLVGVVREVLAERKKYSRS